LPGDRILIRNGGDDRRRCLTRKFVLRHRLRVLEDGVRAVTGVSFAGGRFYVRNLRELVAFQLTWRLAPVSGSR
jgi:hypothetical protein